MDFVFLVDVWFDGHVPVIPSFTQNFPPDKNHPILPAENATWHRHLNGRAGWFLYDSYRGQKGLEGGSCDLSSHQNGSPVFFLGWIKDSRCKGHFENVDAKTCVLGALFHIFFSMVKMSRVISFCGALSI